VNINPFVTAAYPPAVLAYVKSKKFTKKC